MYVGISLGEYVVNRILYKSEIIFLDLLTIYFNSLQKVAREQLIQMNESVEVLTIIFIPVFVADKKRVRLGHR